MVLFLLVGGVALFYLAYRMYKEKSAKETFFASFTHDLKSGLFRLQLEIERLGQSIDDKKIEPLLKESRKMQLDLENSLDSALGEKKKIYIEKIKVRHFLQDLHAQWPELSIHVTGTETVCCDQKALQSLFKNLLHNSFLHGQADEVKVSFQQQGPEVILNYSDNGKELKTDLLHLGRFNKSTGSGFGLFIVRQWVKLLNGHIQFRKSDTGSLVVEIRWPQTNEGA